MKKQKKADSAKSGLVICRTPEEYNLFDPRANRPVYYVKDISENGEPIKEEGVMVVQDSEDIKFNGSNILTYFSPNNVGILLSIKNRALDNAKELYNLKINPDKFNHDISRQDGDRVDKTIEKSKIIYDFIELIQTCIVFSHTALEAFANLSIPHDYKYENSIDQKGIIEIYNKEAIERWLPLKLKLSNILPEIYKTEEITKKPIWSIFIKLEQYRHDIIHQKSIIRTEFYKNYFNKDIFKVCSCAEDIIDFFYKKSLESRSHNSLWPWLINKTNVFPVAEYKRENFERRGSIYDEHPK